MTTGIISTFAGSEYGYTDGPRLTAKFNAISGIAYDKNYQALYVMDRGNYVLRKIDINTGLVSTFAGNRLLKNGFADGDTRNALFSYVFSITVDSAADCQNSAIRKVDPITGVITTLSALNQSGYPIAGYLDGPLSTAQFSIKADLDDNLIVADTFNFVIRKIWLQESKVTTIAGKNGTAGYADGSAINGAIFNHPEGITIYNKTDLIISDTSNQAVRYLKLTCPPPKINSCSAGIYNTSTVAGTPLKAFYNGSDRLTFRDGPADGVYFNRPMGMAWDIDGNLIIAGSISINKRPRTVITIAGGNGNNAKGCTEGVGRDALLSAPIDVTTDEVGNIYVTDGDNFRIVMITYLTHIVTTYAGKCGNGVSRNDNGPRLNAGFNALSGIHYDKATKILYFMDKGNYVLRKLDTTTGIVSQHAGSTYLKNGFSDGSGATGTFNTVWDISMLPSGDLVVVDTGNSAIRKVDKTTGYITTLVGLPGYGISNTISSTVLAGVGGISGGVDGPAATALLRNPFGLTVDPFGNNTDGMVTTISGNISAIPVANTMNNLYGSLGYVDGAADIARFFNPYGIIQDQKGTGFYITDSYNGLIRYLAYIPPVCPYVPKTKTLFSSRSIPSSATTETTTSGSVSLEKSLDFSLFAFFVLQMIIDIWVI